MAEERKVVVKIGKALTFEGDVRKRGEMAKDIVCDLFKEMLLDAAYQIVKQAGLDAEDAGEALDRVLKPTRADEIAPSEKLKAMLSAEDED